MVSVVSYHSMLTLFKLLPWLLCKFKVELTDICRVVDSIKAGRRLPESRYAPLKLAQKSQDSVFAMLSRSKSIVHG